MSTFKTVKAGFSLLSCAICVFTLYSISKFKKQYAIIKRDNLRITSDIHKLKKDTNQLKNSNYSDEKLSEEHMRECQTDNMRKYTHTIKEYNGIIGVFDGEGALVKEVDITVDSLPDADKQDLLIGIRVYSSDELDRILDEFN